MNDQSSRVLIVDDDVDHVELLSEYMRADGFLIEAVHDGAAAVSAALAGRFDAMILDIMMPGISGIEVLRIIRQESQIPILMLTAKGDDIDRIVGLELGADDYMAKPFLPRELVARIRAILRRNYLSPEEPHPRQFGNGLILVDIDKREAEYRGVRLDLTASEFSLLVALVRNTGNVETKDDLSLAVLNRKWTSYDRSIDVHIKNLRQKLTAAGGPDHGIETVRGVGYRIASTA